MGGGGGAGGDAGISPKTMKNNEIKNEKNESKKLENKLKEKMWNVQPKKIHIWFLAIETIWSYGNNVYTGQIDIDESEMDQSDLLKNIIIEFNNKSRLTTKEGKHKEGGTYECA